MADIDNRFRLVKSEHDKLNTHVARLLSPSLIRWLEKRSLYARSEQRSNPIYESLFDPNFITDTNPAVSAVWYGYSDDKLKYLAAQNDSVRFWFVPTPNALASLSYFLGTQQERYTPRISTMFSSNAELLESYYEGNGKNVSGLDMVPMPRVGIWLDYDCDPHYEQRVAAFLRLCNGLHTEVAKQGGGEKLPQFEVLLCTRYKRTTEFLKNYGLEDAAVQRIRLVKEPLEMLAYSQVYLSLDDCPTSYDPMNCLAAALNVSVLSPPRLDTLGLGIWPVSPALINTIKAVMAPGSPGVTALLGTFITPYTELYQQINAAFIASAMSPQTAKD